MSRLTQGLTKPRLAGSLAFALALSSAAFAQETQYDYLVDIDDIVEGVNYDPSPAGSVVRMAVTVSNDSTVDAPATTISFPVPDPADASGSITLVATEGDITNCSPSTFPVAGGTVVTCDVPAIPGRATFDDPANFAQVILDFQTTVETAFTLQPVVPFDAANESNSANNTLTETLTVSEGVDLDIDISGPAQLASGEVFDWFVDLRNIGPNTATNYEIRVPIPAGVINSSPPAGLGCTLDGDAYVCNLSTPLATNESLPQLVFTGQVAVAGASDITPQAFVSGADPLDPVPENDDDFFTIDVIDGTDAFINKTRTPAGSPLLINDEVTFTLSTGFIGNAPTDVVVTDELPANYEFVSVSNDAGYTCTDTLSAATGRTTVSCTLASTGSNGLDEPQDIGEIQIVARVAAAGSGIVNSADIDFGGPGSVDSNPGNNTDSDTAVTIEAPVVDLQARKFGPDPRLAVVGNSYNFNIRARNGGNTEFGGVLTLTDTVPAGLTVTNLNTRGAECTVNGVSVTNNSLAALTPPVAGEAVFVCTFDYTSSPLGAATNTPNITFRTLVTDESPLDGDGNPIPLTNRAEVTSGDPGIDGVNPDNNVATYGVTSVFNGESADIAAVKRLAGSNQVAAGEPISFELEIQNNGPQPSRNVVVTDTVSNLQNGAAPFGISYANTPAGTCSGTGGGSTRTLSCTIAEVPVCGSAPGATAACPVITLTVVPGRDVEPYVAGQTLLRRTNQFRARSQATPDPDLGNDDSNVVEYFMERRADMTVRKSAPSEVDAGRNISYIVSARNANVGLSRAENVTITDTLPPFVRFISATPLNGGSCTTPAPGFTTDDVTPTTVNCSLGVIGPNAQREVRIVVRPTNDARGEVLRNNVRVDTDTIETNPNNNTFFVDTTINEPDVDLLVNKSDDADPVTIGDDVTYTVTVTNNGPSASEDIVVTDTWPDSRVSLREVIAPAGGSCQPASVQVGDGDAPSFGESIVCNFPYLEAGESFDIQYRATAVAKGTVFNNVAITSFEIDNGFDRLAANNATEESTTLRTRTDVAVAKTGPATPQSVGDIFNWTATVTVASPAPGFGEADNVVFTDTLPPNMEIAGVVSAVSSIGAAPSLNECTAVLGSGGASCRFGTMQPGSQVTITIPVLISRVAAVDEVFTNAVRVRTSSFDTDSTNNTDTADVTVVSSTIAGNVYRDFDDDQNRDTGDTNVAGVPVTLTGTNSRGETITPITVLTDGDGNFLFDLLEQGTYTITRGDPSELYLDDGTNTAGRIDGGAPTGTAPVGSDTIVNIELPDDSDSIDNIFRLIPEARIGLAKSGVIDMLNIDGTFDATYTLRVENFSLETIDQIVINDTLTDGVSPLGTYQPTGELVQGSYRIITPPNDGCGTGVATYTGSAPNTQLSTGGSLAPDATCTVTFSVRVFPTDDRRDGPFNNQADVSGNGVLSTQTPRDDSDDGSEPDANGNDRADDAGEDTVTVLTPNTTPAIALVKTSALPVLTRPLAALDEITYTFEVTNTGDLTLTDIEVRDPLLSDDVIGTIAELAPGASDSFDLTYAISQEDLDRGSVTNTAEVIGTDPFGRQPTDDSGTDITNDDPTVTPLLREPAIDLQKTAVISGDQMPTQIGDVITYTFTIRNIGNVTLTDVTLTDDLDGLEFVGAPVAPIPSLDPGETDSTTYSATYIVDEDDILVAGEVRNQALVTGTPPEGDDVEDLSGPEPNTDAETVVPLTRLAALEATKTQVLTDNGDGVDSIGDTITYTITVENTGNVPLSNVRITDTLTDLSGGDLDLTTGPDFVSSSEGSGEGELLVGETATYSATYVIELQAVNAGGTSNTVLAEAEGPAGSGPPGPPVPVDDISDDGIDTDGDTESDPTDLPLSPTVSATGLSMTKTTPLNLVQRGEIVPYTIVVTNENTFVEGPLDIVDRLPNGLIYIPGSATLDGDPADVTFTAGTVTWSDVTVPALGSLEVTLEARVLNGARSGNLVNTVSLIDPSTGTSVISDETATVRIEPETVFECSDVVGKVFNDVNGNGYQDAPETVGRNQITNQDYLGGKGKLAPVIEERDELGLPGVRLATVDGTVITTDENGLFSVPCAALPASGGENFILKVDDRSLPAGYRMTTENPRVTRITPGTMTEMNFGAAVALQVVRVDLTAASFVQTAQGTAMSPALTNGLQGVLQQIAGAPSNMVLAFHLPPSADADDVAAARRLLDMVETQVRRDWRDIGRVRLRIEQSIVRAGQ